MRLSELQCVVPTPVIWAHPEYRAHLQKGMGVEELNDDMTAQVGGGGDPSPVMGEESSSQRQRDKGVGSPSQPQ